jgi:hypothetical protein
VQPADRIGPGGLSAPGQKIIFLKAIAPQVDYQVMGGVGNFLMWEEPGAFNELLTTLLRKEGLVQP